MIPADPPPHTATLRAHLAYFVCIVNELRPVYPALESNNLSTGALGRIVHRCSRAEVAARPPALTSDGRFLTRFLIKNCGNYLAPKAGGNASSTTNLTAALQAASLREPAFAQLNRSQLRITAPRWAWDADVYSSKKWQQANIVQDFFGVERELGRFRGLIQNQPAVSMAAPRWRRQDLQEWEHQPRDALEFRPGLAWVNAEMWAAPKGKDTRWHYDYDSHVMLIQVSGSKRFRVLPPQSGALTYEPLAYPPDKPIDYGTRWANVTGDAAERIFETHPGSVLKIPNGWPHMVKYNTHSIAFRIASWTQCQGLSMWLGQRLCLLSTLVQGTFPRTCFDDETYREYGAYRKMEDSMLEV